MGNIVEVGLKTNAYKYIESLERSFITQYMVEDMLSRWNDLGKPLFMIPKDFRDRILLNMNKEVRLNYLKWLQLGLEIDMFEIMSILILYSRCDLNKRLELIFELFCYNDETYMQKGEFKFMMNKLCNAIGLTIQIKKSFLQELMRNVDTKLLSKNKEYIYQVDFIQSMNLAFKDLNERLLDITSKCDVFSLQIRQDRIPEYLKPGNYFLGQYLITDIISYANIETEKVYMQSDTVFQGQSSF